jgi:hypothetical protein
LVSSPEEDKGERVFDSEIQPILVF